MTSAPPNSINPIASARIGASSGTRALLFASLGLVDLVLQEVVEQGPQDHDGRELADFVPGRGDGGARDVGGDEELQGERQPAAEPKADFLLDVVRMAGGRLRGAVADEDDERSQRRLDRGEPDDERGRSLRPRREPQRARLETLHPHPLRSARRERERNYPVPNGGARAVPG